MWKNRLRMDDRFGSMGVSEGDKAQPMTERYRELIRREKAAAFDRLETYALFAEQVKETKRKLLEFLIKAKRKERLSWVRSSRGKATPF